MHGRPRVRRTEEQELLRQQKKKQAEAELRKLLASVFKGRADGVCSKEALELTEKVVDSNPDNATIWNYRRTILEQLFMSSNSSTVDQTTLLDHELLIIAQHLLRNPKSYCLWFHRMWVMQNHPSPNWKNELIMCNKGLFVDGRNFHCWQYRRFITEKGKIPVKEELLFTKELIEDNMSNYSAWADRHHMLSSLDSDFSTSLPFSPPPVKSLTKPLSFLDGCSILGEELDFVRNAIYADPKDESPWSYYWGLLGRGNKRAYLRDLYISRDLQRIVCVFTSAKSYSAIRELDSCIKVSYPGGEPVSLSPKDLGDWQCALDGQISAVWWLAVCPEYLCSRVNDGLRTSHDPNQLEFDVSVCIRNDDNPCEETTRRRNPNCPLNHVFCLTCCLNATQTESLTRVDLDPLRLLNGIISPVNEPNDLNSELESLRELLSLEPRNKMALLTWIALLRFIRPPDYLKETDNAFQILKEVDHQRIRCYTDMQSLHVVQDALAAVYSAHEREVSLSNLKLTHLPYSSWCALMTKIDLSGNQLKMLPDTLGYLVCLCELNVDDNLLETLKGIGCLRSLQTISVRRNLLANFDSIGDLLSLPNLHTVSMDGNEVTKLSDLTDFLAEHPLSKTRKNSFVVSYERQLSE